MRQFSIASRILALATPASVLLLACGSPQAGLIEPAKAPADAPRPDTSVVIRSRDIRIAVDRIPGAPRLTLPTFDAETLQLVRDRTAELTPKATLWYGHVDGQLASTATFVVRKDIVIGNIRAGRRSYEIRSLGKGVHRLSEVDPRRYSEEGEPGVPQVEPQPDEDACATDPPTDIDVLAVYTQDARAGAGGPDAMEAMILLAVEETNQAYINSAISQRIHLVHMAEVAYTESGVSETDRNILQGTSDGTLDNVHALRNTYGADLVIMITQSLERCGRAYIMETVSPAFEAFAFAVVRLNCATGSFSFGHELGHIMSARHDWPGDPTNNTPYTFNHGHYVAVPADNNVDPWGTIMTGNAPCGGLGCTRIQHWSNPYIDYPPGGNLTDPTGTATGDHQTDNHQTLGNTALTVANFRCASPGSSTVWMKDTWNDTGREPDAATAGEAMWRSPYIWVRNSQDAGLTHQHQHQNPQFGSTNWIYVKVHNASMSPQSGTLQLYYANASTSLTWPSAWTPIGGVPVTALGAHGTRIVEHQWSSIPSAGHFCLLARWVSPSDPMVSAEGPNIGDNVRANNNLVWRNVNVVDLTTADAAEEDSITIQSSAGKDSVIESLRIDWTPDERRPSFLTVGEVSVRLDRVLEEAWKRGGERGRGFERDRRGLRISPSGAQLENLVLPPGRGGRLYIRMHRLPTTPRRPYWLEVAQFTADTAIGGVTYEIRTDRVE
jgi:hypothetical protein